MPDVAIPALTAASALTGTEIVPVVQSSNSRRTTTQDIANLVSGIGKHTIYQPARGMIARTSNGAAAGTAELATNKIMLASFDFDAAADEFVQFDVWMPKSWNEGTVTAVFRWTAASGSGDVIWGIQGLARSNDDALDTAFGSAATVTDTLLTADDEHHTAETGAITIGGTPAENDAVIFQVYRDADAGGDTLAVDAKLLGVKIIYTTNARSDD